MTRSTVGVTSALLTLGALSARPADADVARSAESEPEARPTLVWILTQLIPSPEVAAGTLGAHFGLRWQVTPILYSFGMRPGLSPWRALVVEPIVRQSGSIELFLSPEIFTGSLIETPLVRVGVRSYFPLVGKGDDLSVSLGTAYTNMNGQDGVGYEAGIYVLYGTVGLQVTYAPAPSPVQWITTLRIRYF